MNKDWQVMERAWSPLRAESSFWKPQGNNMNAEYYQLNGIKREKLQRGINIIRNNDGTAKKVVVK